MTTDTRAINFSMDDKDRDYLAKKLERLHYAQDLLVNLSFVITRENKTFKAACTASFRWGTSAHVEDEDFEVPAAIDKMFDRLEVKISKEKEKIQQKG
jgi:putative sigma-54 modulation protein